MTVKTATIVGPEQTQVLHDPTTQPIPLKFYKPFFPAASRQTIMHAIDRILESGQLMLGEYSQKLEAGFAAYHGAERAVSTNSCTSALQIALMHYGVAGREVLVPSAGFITDVSAIRWAGGTPVLVDTDPATLSFDLDDLTRKITPRTAGMIWVHLIGLISPAWRDILAIARDRDLFVIEDCAHAHGASINGKMAGTFGDVGCFSFYPTKVMTSGTGGILITNDLSLDKSAREIRLFGRENGSGNVIREGNDWFLDEIRACVAYAQLQDLDLFLDRRRSLAERYTARLAGLPGIKLLDIPADNLPAWYHFATFVDPSIDYKQLASRLLTIHGIPTKSIYVPLHQEAIFRDLDDGSLKQAESMLNHSLCLPLYFEMLDEQADWVADVLTQELTSL